MKKTIAIVIMICALVVFPVTGCKKDAPASGPAAVEIAARDVTVKQAALEGYDYTALFTITADGEDVPVLAEYVDSSAVKSAAGTYLVVCTYYGAQKGAMVTVQTSAYSVAAKVDEVSVRKREVSGYDFKSLFTVTVDGEEREISDSMVTTQLAAAVGDYDYTVSLGGASATVRVHVTENRIIEIVPAYAVYKLAADKIDGFDPTALFSLYLDGEAVRVTADMIDASALEGARAGDEIDVSLTYSAPDEGGDVTATVSARVSVVEPDAIAIAAKNVTTYPNAPAIDLTTLFTITKGDEEIPVTIDMIEGEIDYTRETNEITLTYEGETATATVTVTYGVIIEYAASDTVMVLRGTDKYAYNYAKDFIVIINGSRQYVLPDTCFDIGEVDFDREGTYTVTLTILYNDQQAGVFSAPTIVPVTKTITYLVTDYAYSASVVNESVTLPAGTTSYDARANVTLTINGTRQRLVADKASVDPLCTYAEVSDVDFASSEEQTVTVTFYPAGRHGNWTICDSVSFRLTVQPVVSLTCFDRIVFEGATLYARDLFTITENGNSVKVTDDMIEGKVDTFVSGVYNVAATYKDAHAVCRVVVYPREFVGTYTTRLTPMPEEEEYDDEDVAPGWGGGFDEMGDESGFSLLTLEPSASPAAAATPAVPTYIGRMIIDESGLITFNGHTSRSVKGIDANTMEIEITTGDVYTLYYDEGVAVLDVRNTSKMNYNDYKRPLLYVKTDDLYRLRDIVTVNSSDKYVLADTLTVGTWSLDAIGYSDSADPYGEIMWYGLYVQSVYHTNPDHLYRTKWGKVTFDDGFVNAAGTTSALQFDGERIEFTLSEKGVGKAAKTNGVLPPDITSNTWQGTIGGKAYVLAFSVNSALGSIRYTLTGGDDAFGGNISDVKRGGFGRDADGTRTVFLYSSSGGDAKTFYSFKFRLHTDGGAHTFEYVERDKYFGRYVSDNYTLFLDGYGGGEFTDGGTGASASSEIAYDVHGNELTVRFESYNPVYPYGESASFFVSQLLNVLTVKSSHNNCLAGISMENQVITDGAIVRAPAFLLLDKSGGTIGAQIRDSVTVITAAGEYSAQDKENYIGTNAVYDRASGFCLYTITVKVGGEPVTMKYTVQIVNENESFAGSDVVGLLSGTANGSVSISIAESGLARVTVDAATYRGTATATPDGFVVKAYSTVDNRYIGARGIKQANGVYLVQFDGAIRSSDWFARASVTVSSASGSAGVLRKFTSGGETVYSYSDSPLKTGVRVQVTENGGECEVSPDPAASGSDAFEPFTAVVKWGNTENGFEKKSAAV